MKYRKVLITAVMALSLFVVFVLPCSAQYREYYIYGKIVDENDQPLPKVKIILRDVRTSRGYSVKSNKKGEFKFAGLPHGIYRVTMEKAGYQTRTDEWKFETPQTRMQKVDVKTTVLVSESKVKEMKLAKELESHLKGAADRVRQGDYDGALELLEKICAERPDDANAHYMMGICYLKKQVPARAIEAFKKVTELKPSFPGGHYQLGICYQQNKEPEKALACYKKALELEPANLVSLFNGGIILYDLKRYAEAVPYFEKALGQKPGSGEILEMLGMCYLQTGDYSKSLEYLEKAKAAAKDPEKIKSLEELVKGLKEQG